MGVFMKISRLGSITLALMLLMPSFQTMTADLYTTYKIYKDPVARAQVIEKIQTARATAQERLQAGITHTKEKAAEGWKTGTEFARRHKQKLIAGGVTLLTLAAIMLARLGYDRHQRSMIRARTEKEFLDTQREGIRWDVDQTHYNILLVYGDMIQGLNSLNVLRNQLIHNQPTLRAKQNMALIFDDDIKTIPGLREALERLAKEKPFEPILLKKG